MIPTNTPIAFIEMQEIIKPVPDDWVYALAKNRIDDQIVEHITDKLKGYIGSTRYHNRDYSPIYYCNPNDIKHFSIERADSLIEALPDHLLVRLKFGTNPEENDWLFFREVNLELIDFIRGRISRYWFDE